MIYSIVMFVHASIRSRNLDESIKFYTKHFNLVLVSRQEIPQNSAEIAFLQDPKGEGPKLELTFYKKQTKFIQSDYEDRLFDHLAFQINDIKETIRIMKSDGVAITDEPFRLSKEGSLIAFVEDPDGTLIELIEKT